jgi:hypothetical protein
MYCRERGLDLDEVLADQTFIFTIFVTQGSQWLRQQARRRQS